MHLLSTGTDLKFRVLSGFAGEVANLKDIEFEKFEKSNSIAYPDYENPREFPGTNSHDHLPADPT